jgi:2-phospho-L-lactate/phosphoenolpyruvate guanylyltransferase
VRIILVAAKQLALAKSRLAPALPSSAERAALAEAMFRDVLNAAVSARRAERVAVVTSDQTLIGIARAAGAMIVDEEYPRGLNVAVRLATTELMRTGATAIGTVLSDIPLVSGPDIDAAFAALPAGDRGVVLIPSRDFSGTNMMVRTPPDVITTQFGRLSLVRHREDCRQRGIACAVVRQSGPALDLDVPADLIEFARTPSMTHTWRQLERLGLHAG